MSEWEKCFGGLLSFILDENPEVESAWISTARLKEIKAVGDKLQEKADSFDKLNTQLIAENFKLQEENKQLKETFEKSYDELGEYIIENEQLKQKLENYSKAYQLSVKDQEGYVHKLGAVREVVEYYQLPSQIKDKAKAYERIHKIITNNSEEKVIK